MALPQELKKMIAVNIARNIRAVIFFIVFLLHHFLAGLFRIPLLIYTAIL